MKKILALFLFIIAGCLIFTACGDTKDPVTYYSVEFDSNGAERYTPRELASGSFIIEPAQPERGGYYFTGWYLGDKLWNFEVDTVTENMTLVAGWNRIKYAVSFDTDGGEGSYPDRLVPSGDPVSLPAEPTRDGYTFLGWYLGEDVWNFDVDPVVGDMTLKARWEEIVLPVYKVTFNTDGGTQVSSKSVTEGECVAVPTSPTKNGHNFAGWYCNGVLYNFELPVTADITLVAAWEEIIIPTYSVTFDSNGGSAIETQHPVENTAASRPVDPIYPMSDTEIRVPTFLGWYKDGVLYDFTTPVTEDIVLTAQWSIEIYYKIIFKLDDNTENDKTYIIEKGEKLPVIRPTKDDYRFAGWYVGSSSFLFDEANTVPSSNLVLTAAWTPIPTYKVTFDADGGSSSISEQTVIEGGYVSAPPIPTRSGYRFDGWYNGKNKWDFNSMTVSGPITLTAKWVEQVTIIFNDDNGERIYARTIDKGALIPAYQNPTKDNYRFDGWYSDEVLWNFETMTANGNVTLVAKWVRQYTVTFNTDCDIAIESQIVDENGYIIRPNTPQRGTQYSFDGWYIENTEIEWVFVGDDKMAVTGDINLIARWSIMTPPDIFIK